MGRNTQKQRHSHRFDRAVLICSDKHHSHTNNLETSYWSPYSEMKVFLCVPFQRFDEDINSNICFGCVPFCSGRIMQEVMLEMVS